ncbi:MAG: thiolase family protein [Chloroflexi bacterium]|nr:thiolase family protein [Chloroflexota bacterium]
MTEAAKEAIHDAGIDRAEVDGLLVYPPLAYSGHILFPTLVAEHLHLRPRYANVVHLGGASAAGMVWRAAAAIATGMCRTVLCLTGEAGEVRRSHQGGVAPRPSEGEFEISYGPLAPTHAYALIAQRHMHEYGTTSRQLAKVAVDQRFNACANPMAFFHGQPVTIEDVLNSRLVCDPLHLLDIVRPCAGAAALVVTSDSLAKRAKCPVSLLGAAEAVSHTLITHAPSLTTTAIADTSARAFAMAGVTPQDIDLASIYDCYTIMVPLTLEDAGFCPKGQGGPFVEEHDITYKGDFPVNTHGGQLSFGQPAVAGGMSHITEAVRQLRGEAGQRQLRKCEVVFVNGNGGVIGEECSLILGR